MSDCFDHALDACDSAMDCFYGDRRDNSGYVSHGFKKSYYETYPIHKVIAATDKAYLLSIEEGYLPFVGDEFDIREHRVRVWIPKSVITSDEPKPITAGDEDIFIKIHTETLKRSLQYCIPRQKELYNGR